MGMKRSLLLVTLTLTLTCSLVAGEWKGKDCPVDESIGLSDPNNVYSCNPEETCCTKNLSPACCATKPTDQVVQEQLTLWGTLLGIILVLGLFIWFCRSDQSLLDAETPCLQKFCSCCGFQRRGDDGHLHNKDSEFGSTTSIQSKSTMLLMNEHDETEIEDNAANLEAVLEPEEGEEEAAPEAPDAEASEEPPAEDQPPPAEENPEDPAPEADAPALDDPAPEGDSAPPADDPVPEGEA